MTSVTSVIKEQELDINENLRMKKKEATLKAAGNIGKNSLRINDLYVLLTYCKKDAYLMTFDGTHYTYCT